MKKIVKIELSRSFKNNGFYLAFSIGLVLIILHFITGPLLASFTIYEYLSFDYPMKYPGWLYVAWMGGDLNSVFSYLYFLILPILAALPFSDSFFTDVKGGFIQNLCIRLDRKDYYKAKYLAAFLSGGTVVTLPLLANFILSAMVLPCMKPEVSAGNGLIGDMSTFPELYYNYPILYVFLFLAIIFIFSGLLADLGLLSSYIFGYRFLVLISPFIAYIFLMAGCNLIGLTAWQPTNFLRPGYYENTLLPIIIETLTLFLITMFGFVYRGGKGDIY